jgi:hypothetical protein
MSANRARQVGMPGSDSGLRYYPAPLPAGPWVIPLFWLVVLLVAALAWLL